MMMQCIGDYFMSHHVVQNPSVDQFRPLQHLHKSRCRPLLRTCGRSISTISMDSGFLVDASSGVLKEGSGRFLVDEMEGCCL